MAGTTALLRSAASIRDQLATYQDSVQAYEYANSAYTDSALSNYSSYLQQRIDALNKSGSISDASKALSLTKALDSATKSNISATIQRENIQVMAGNASLTDKYNVVANQFVRAQANGDMTLAQSLMSQAYSISQSIQLQQQQAADAAVTLSKANAAAAKSTASFNARSDVNVGKNIIDELKQFNTDYAHAGQKSANKVISDFVDKMKPQFEALGIHLQKGQQPNYFDVVDGANRAAFTAYTNAGLAVSAYAEDGGQSYYDKATALVDKIPTIYGNMNANQLASAAANPNQFSYSQDPEFVGSKGNSGVGGKQNPQVGYDFANGKGIVPTFSNSPWIQIPTETNNRLQALNLHVIAKSDNTYEVAATNQSPAWLKQVLPANSTAHIVASPNDASQSGQLENDGRLTFEADSIHGSGKAIYTIAKDNTVWESSNLGDRLISGGQNLTQPGVAHGSSFGFDNFANNVHNWFGGLEHGVGKVFGGLMGHASAQGLLDSATNHYTLPPPPIPVAPIAQLPSLHVAPPPPPSAPLRVSAPARTAVRPPTYNPQPTVSPQHTAPSPQQTSTPQWSGGGFNLNQSGGGGIRLY